MSSGMGHDCNSYVSSCTVNHTLFVSCCAFVILLLEVSLWWLRGLVRLLDGSVFLLGVFFLSGRRLGSRARNGAAACVRSRPLEVSAWTNFEDCTAPLRHVLFCLTSRGISLVRGPAVCGRKEFWMERCCSFGFCLFPLHQDGVLCDCMRKIHFLSRTADGGSLKAVACGAMFRLPRQQAVLQLDSLRHLPACPSILRCSCHACTGPGVAPLFQCRCSRKRLRRLVLVV